MQWHNLSNIECAQNIIYNLWRVGDRSFNPDISRLDLHLAQDRRY